MDNLNTNRGKTSMDAKLHLGGGVADLDICLIFWSGEIGSHGCGSGKLFSQPAKEKFNLFLLFDIASIEKSKNSCSKTI